MPKGTVYHRENRGPIENIRKYLSYGKSYSRIAYIHEMSLNFKPKSSFTKTSVLDFLKIVVSSLLFLLGINALISSNFNEFYFLLILIPIFLLFIFYLISIIKNTEILYRIYKFSIVFTIIIYSLIYMNKN